MIAVRRTISHVLLYPLLEEVESTGVTTGVPTFQPVPICVSKLPFVRDFIHTRNPRRSATQFIKNGACGLWLMRMAFTPIPSSYSGGVPIPPAALLHPAPCIRWRHHLYLHPVAAEGKTLLASNSSVRSPTLAPTAVNCVCHW